MKPRTALLAAIGCGAAAVLLVAVDLAYNLDATLEVRGADGSWREVARLGGSEPVYSPYCGSHFRLTLHNGLPWSAARSVTIQASGGDGQTRILLDETWHLARGETKVHEFDVPNATLEQRTPGSPVPAKVGGSVQVILGTGYREQMGASACAEGAA